MLHLSVAPTFIYVVLLYALVFPIGYLLLHLMKLEKFLALPFFVRLPIYLAIGLISSISMYFMIGLVTINAYVAPAICLLTLLLLIWRKRRGSWPSMSVPHNVLENIFPFLLFLVSLVYITSIVGTMIWPNPGDTISHGFYTSLILYQRKMPFTFEPISPLRVLYPLGFHVLAACLASSINIYPAEAVFLIAAAIVIIFPSILYSLTYIYTKSKTFSLFSYLSAYIWTSYSWASIMHCFHNGTYPRLYGYLIASIFCVLIAITNPLNRDGNNEKNDLKHFAILSILVLFTMTIVYPSFSPYIFIFLIVCIFMNRGFVGQALRKMKISTIIFLLVALVFSGYIIYTGFFGFIITHLPKSLLTYIPPEFFYNCPTGIAVLLAAGIALFFLIKRINVGISLFYFIVFIPQLLTLYHPFYFHLVALTPYKAIMMNGILSWVMLSLFSHFLIDKLSAKKYIFYEIATQESIVPKKLCLKKIRLKVLTNALVLIIIISGFAPTIILNATSIHTKKPGWWWFVRSPETLPYDFAALEWINQNISNKDLVLNIPSWSALYLESFSIKNMTHYYIIDHQGRARAKETRQIWENPTDFDLLMGLLKKYDVKYIFVTSEWGYYDWWGFGGDWKYKGKKYNYTQIYDDVPFLKCVFRKGNTRVYKVGNLSEIEIKLYEPYGEVLVLSFNEGEGNIAYDESGFGNNGTIYGGSWVEGNFGSALSFVQMDDYVEVPFNTTGFDENHWSIEAWVYIRSSKEYETIIRDSVAVNNMMGLLSSWNGDCKACVYVRTNLGYYRASDPMECIYNEWVHCVGILDGTTLKLYKNGREVATTTIYGTINDVSGLFYLGKNGRNGDYFDGIIDGVRIYNRALSAYEVWLSWYTQNSPQ